MYKGFAVGAMPGGGKDGGYFDEAMSRRA